MKYCPRCKTRVPDDRSTCATCGGAVKSLGGKPAAPGGGAGTGTSNGAPSAGGEAPEELMLQLQGLQEAVEAGKARTAFLGCASVALGLVMVAVLVWLYFSDIFRYAPLQELNLVTATEAQVEGPNAVRAPDGTVDAGTALLRFRPSGKGLVEFELTNDAGSQTLIEHIPALSEYQQTEFRMTGAIPREPGQRARLRVRYRRFFSYATETWELRAATK